MSKQTQKLLREVGLSLLAASAVLTGLSCGGGDATAPPTTGVLRITSSTSGPASDADGYTINLDGTEHGSLGSTGDVTLEALAPGEHMIGLSGVAGNCGVQGDNPRTVTIAAGQSITVGFSVTCSTPPSTVGTLTITTSTTGPDLDPNGYTFAVDDRPSQPIAINSSITLTNVNAGVHRVELSGIAATCRVEGTNPQSATVTGGTTAGVSFAVDCTPTPGSLEITITTTGPTPDPDGYTVTVTRDVGFGNPKPPVYVQDVGANAKLAVPAIPSGVVYHVELSGLADHCWVEGDVLVGLLLSPGEKAPVSFVVRCALLAAYRAIALGGTGSNATAINDAGQVVGSSGGHAVLWEKGVVIDLGTLDGSSSAAMDINSAGQVVGYYQRDHADHAFLWDKGVMTDLARETHSYATAINDVGQVVGSNKAEVGAPQRAVLWEKGVMTDLGTLGGSSSEAADINQAGQVVGSSSIADPCCSHAFLWDKYVMTDLGTLGGSSSAASAINDAGQVVGSSQTADGVYHAFLWEKGVMTDLGTLGASSNASDINSANQVVGSYARDYARSGLDRPFVWEEGVMAVLGTSGGLRSEATGINAGGQIVGSTESPSSESHATLWTRE